MFRRWILGLLIWIIPTLSHAQTLSVAAAASMRNVLEAISAQYQSSHGRKIKCTYGSSGQLMMQINHGAPIDLFLSAAKKQVDDLAQSGTGDAATATVFAGNELVLIAPVNAKWSPAGFDQLANPKVHRLAVGEPRTVPAGQYAAELLDHLHLTDSLKGRLIDGQNVRQVLQYVEDGDVDAGIVYLTDAKEAGNKVKLIATADASWYQAIEYWGIVVAASNQKNEAKKFLDYLKSAPAQATLKAAGFSAPTAPATQPTSKPTEAGPKR